MDDAIGGCRTRLLSRGRVLEACAVAICVTPPEHGGPDLLSVGVVRRCALYSRWLVVCNTTRPNRY